MEVFHFSSVLAIAKSSIYQRFIGRRWTLMYISSSPKDCFHLIHVLLWFSCLITGRCDRYRSQIYQITGQMAVHVCSKNILLRRYHYQLNYMVDGGCKCIFLIITIYTPFPFLFYNGVTTLQPNAGLIQIIFSSCISRGFLIFFC